ncbi:MAG: hypothetical protein AAF604_20455 [Acidobacteriota bacterium]
MESTIAATRTALDLADLDARGREVFHQALERGIVQEHHLRRTFESLAAARSLPEPFDHKTAVHFANWLEIINQPFFKPIITARGRLDTLIRILAANPWHDLSGADLEIGDLGTGQPPYTTVDLAEHFGHGRVDGFDLYEPEWLIVRPNGDYALFDEHENIMSVYCPDVKILHDMVSRWGETEQEFRSILHRAQAQSAADGDGTFTFEGGEQVTRHPTERLRQSCSNQRLTFHINPQGGFELPLADAGLDVLWSFNCLLHYPLEERMVALRSLGRKVRPDGLIFEGYTSPTGGHAVYTAWQRQGDALEMREFGFSVPNYRYPLWPLHERDPQVEAMNGVIARAKDDPTLGPALRSDLDTFGAVTRGNLPSLVEFYGAQGLPCRLREESYLAFEPLPGAARIELAAGSPVPANYFHEG